MEIQITHKGQTLKSHTLSARKVGDDLEWSDLLGAAAKEFLLRRLPKSILKHPYWQDYVDEAEHQDGTSYWLGFPSTKALVEDFQLAVRVIRTA